MKMKKTYLGMEIGSSELKLAVCIDDKIKKIVSEKLPSHLVENEVIVEWDKLAVFIKQTIKKHNITCKNVALVLPEEIAYARRFIMPYMTISQLKFNLPFEFHDFTGTEKDKYIYDYAVMDIIEEEENGTMVKKIDLMAAAISREIMEKYRAMLKKCGLKLKIAAPQSSAYQNIVKKHINFVNSEKAGDYAIIDIEKDSANLRIFTEGKYESSREMETGIEKVIQIISDILNIDKNPAEKYLLKNEGDALYAEECMAVYSQIALETMRVINFFLYNHPNNALDTLYCCGLGANIDPLLNILEETVGLKVRKLHELFDYVAEEEMEITSSAAAVGITWN